MGVLDQLDLDAVKRPYRADLPVPIDVLNLIHFKDEDTYKSRALSSWVSSNVAVGSISKSPSRVRERSIASKFSRVMPMGSNKE
jgi:hypothetical protein